LRNMFDHMPGAGVPMVAGNIPTFLGSKRVRSEDELGNLDAVIVGLPWEGTNTWGSFSTCEQSPKGCRIASMRYGNGYIPEYDIEVMKSLKLGDMGDLPACSTDVEKTFDFFTEGAKKIFARKATPIFLGGDHACTYPVLRALAEQRPHRVGILHFDAHLDNADAFLSDNMARCCPLRRIAETKGIDPTKIVHFGIRGPRNTVEQMDYARKSGATVLTMATVRELGLEKAIAKAYDVITDGTDGYYVTVCSDIIDHAWNIGGPLDFNGLSVEDMCNALYTLAQGPMLGMDIVEVYPKSDFNDTSLHIVTWLAIYALAGLAIRQEQSVS
jgi:guanidinopropionase